jgi:hypothetical protein
MVDDDLGCRDKGEAPVGGPGLLGLARRGDAGAKCQSLPSKRAPPQFGCTGLGRGISRARLTTYGNTSVAIGAHLRLLGAREALNGIILFGLTTACMG